MANFLKGINKDMFLFYEIYERKHLLDMRKKKTGFLTKDEEKERGNIHQFIIELFKIAKLKSIDMMRVFISKQDKHYNKKIKYLNEVYYTY